MTKKTTKAPRAKTKPKTTKVGKFEKCSALVIDAVAKGCSYRQACSVAGIGEATFYVWMKQGQTAPHGKFVEFRESILKAEANNGQRMLELIQNHAVKDWKAAAWVLERRHGFCKDGRIDEQQIEKVDLPTNTYELLKQQATNLAQAMAQAQTAQSWQAYAALQRQLLQVVQQLRQIEAEENMQDEYTGFTDQQLLTEITNAIITLPPVLRQELEQTIQQISNIVPIQGSKA
jgi:transposase